MIFQDPLGLSVSPSRLGGEAKGKKGSGSLVVSSKHRELKRTTKTAAGTVQAVSPAKKSTGLTNPHRPRVAPSAGPPEWGRPSLGTKLGSPSLPGPWWGRSRRHLTSTASNSSARIDSRARPAWRRPVSRLGWQVGSTPSGWSSWSPWGSSMYQLE